MRRSKFWKKLALGIAYLAFLWLILLLLTSLEYSKGVVYYPAVVFVTKWFPILIIFLALLQIVKEFKKDE